MIGPCKPGLLGPTPLSNPQEGLTKDTGPTANEEVRKAGLPQNQLMKSWESRRSIHSQPPQSDACCFRWLRAPSSGGWAEISSFITVVQSLSRVRLFATPCTAALPASPSFTISRSLLKLMSTESVMPSNHLILYCPLLLLPSIFPSIRIFSNELALCTRWPKYWSSASVLLMKFRIDFL